MSDVTIKWKVEGNRYFTAKLGWKDGDGGFALHLQPRPLYCDRGDWMLDIEAFGQAQTSPGTWEPMVDGFPRFFFGNEEEAKEQFNRWAKKRKDLKDLPV